MAVLTKFSDYGQKGLVELTIIDNSTTPATILAIPPASGGVYDPGAENGEFERTNCRAERVRDTVFRSVSKPTFQIDLGYRNPEAISLRLNRKFEENASATIRVHRTQFKVPATGIVPAVASGYLGYGVSADPSTANGSYSNEFGRTAQMAPGTYASFDSAATPTGFAIGDNGALKFGDDLKSKEVSFYYDYDGTVWQTGSLAFTNISLYAKTVSVNQYVTEWVADDVSVDATGQIALAEPTQQISFFVNGDVLYRTTGLLNQC